MSKSIFLFDNISCRCLNCDNYYSIQTKGECLSTLQLPHTQEEIPIQFLPWYSQIDFKNMNGYLGTVMKRPLSSRNLGKTFSSV